MKLSSIFRIPFLIAAFAIGYYGLKDTQIYWYILPLLALQGFLLWKGDKMWTEWRNKVRAKKEEW